MIVEVILAASLLLNFILAFYCVKLARKLFVVASNLNAVYEMFDAFRQHVEQVHEAEMFYGDQTLQALIQHSKDVLEVLDGYEDIMEIVLLEDEEEKGDGEEEN